MLGLITRRIVRPIRRSLWTALVRRRASRVEGRLTVNYYSRVNRQTTLGRNVNLNGMIVYGGGRVTIGDNFHSGRDCVIITTDHNYEGASIPYDHTVISRDVAIGDNVWIGTRVMILGGVSIGEGAIIQAGSVVVSDVPRCAIAGGHPARVFKHRDVQHYEELKRLGRTY